MFKRGIFLLADGARFDLFEKLLEAGELPHIAQYLLKTGSLRKATSVFPSTTGPAYLPFLSGRYPGPVNLSGIRWFDRAQYAKGGFSLKKFRSYVGVESALMSADLNPVQSVFNLWPRSFSVFSTIAPGVRVAHNATKWIRMAYCYYAHVSHNWAAVDKAAKNCVLSLIEKNDPEFIFAVFPAIDEYAHLTSPFSPETLKAYRDFDHHVGEIARKLEEKNQLQDTLMVISADHGLSDTHTHFPLEVFLEGLGLKTFYYPLIFRKNFDVAIAVSGNGMAHLYFKGKEGWAKPIYKNDLTEIYPNVLRGLLNAPAVEIIAAKDCFNGKMAVAVMSALGEGRIFKNDQGLFCFENVTGRVLGIDDFPGGLNEEEALGRTFNSQFPDAVVQLWQIFQSARTGDLVVTAKMGFDLRERFERPEHHASHGALHAEHMHVPVVCNAPLAQGPMRTVDVFPTMAFLMGHPQVETLTCDGVGRSEARIEKSESGERMRYVRS